MAFAAYRAAKYGRAAIAIAAVLALYCLLCAVAVRYEGWRKIKGAVDTSSESMELLDLGKHLLGYMENQRKLSGVKTMSRAIELPYGKVFAAFYGDIPVIEVYPLAPETKPLGNTIEGFVVRPATTADAGTNTPDDFVLLDPVQSWKPYFYQAADLPTAPGFPVGVHKVDSRGRSLFANGLMHYGNVDWRNADESLICSWWGPTARYFGAENSLSKYLFCHGQVLLDVTALPVGFFGDTSVYSTSYAGRTGKVIGACLANVKDVGACALVVVRFGARNGSTRKEFLVRVSIESDDPRGVQSPLAQSAWFKLRPAQGATPAGAPVILWSQDVTLRDEEHPWFFNQSYTEARALRYFDDADNSFANPSTQECVLKVNEAGVWEYTEIEHAGGNVTTTTAVNGTSIAYGIPVVYPSWIAGDPDGAFGATYRRLYLATPNHGGEFEFDVGTGPALTGVDYGPHGIAGDGSAANLDQMPVTGIKTTSVLGDKEKLPIAVDFRDDEPVYAYGYLPNNTETNSSTNSNTFAATGSASGPGAHAVTGTFSATSSGSGDHVWGSTATKSGITGGIEADWIAVSTADTRAATSLGTCHVSVSGSASIVCTWNAGPNHYSFSVPGLGNPFNLSISLLDCSGSASLVASSSDKQVTQRLAILYLDLRYKWLVYQNATTTTTQTQSASASDTIPDSAGLALDTVESITVSVSSNTDSSTVYSTRLNDVELATSEVTSSSSSSSSYTDPSTPFGAPMKYTQFLCRFPCFLGVFPSTDHSGVIPTSTSSTTNDAPAVSFWSGMTWEENHDAVGANTAFMQQSTYGSWQSYKGNWCFSQPLPTGDGSTANYVFKGGPKDDPPPDIKARTNTDTDSSIVRFHPIWVLPSVAY